MQFDRYNNLVIGNVNDSFCFYGPFLHSQKNISYCFQSVVDILCALDFTRGDQRGKSVVEFFVVFFLQLEYNEASDGQGFDCNLVDILIKEDVLERIVCSSTESRYLDTRTVPIVIPKNGSTFLQKVSALSAGIEGGIEGLSTNIIPVSVNTLSVR